MERGKYIVVEINGLETAILFPCWINHCDMAQRFLNVVSKVVSAGQFQVGSTMDRRLNICCYGKSVSLKVESRCEEDAEILRATLGLDRDEVEI